MSNEVVVTKTIQNLPEELKLNVFNALNNPDFKLSDCYGQEIEVQAWLVYPVEMKNKETGELEILPRTIMIDTEGKSYSAMSRGFAGAIGNYQMIFGNDVILPTPIKIKITQEGTGMRKYTSFKLV